VAIIAERRRQKSLPPWSLARRYRAPDRGNFYNRGTSLFQVYLKEEDIVSAKLFCIAGLGLVMSASVFLAQRSPAATEPQIGFPQDQAQKEMQDRMMKEANKKRQQDIRDETDKLFQLATELKAAVDKTNENMLSLDVIKKAEQVEKLAKKVKENMREAVGPTQNGPPPVPVPTPFSH